MTEQSHSHHFHLTAKELKTVNNRLELWGKLTNWEQGQFLDHASKSNLDTISKLGIAISRSHQVSQWPYHIEQVDQLLNALSKHKPKWSKALIYHYTHRGSLRQQASQCGIAKSTFYERLQKARKWLGMKMRHHHTVS